MTGQDDDIGRATLLADAGLAVDLGLVLSVDCSSSIDAGDFKIQMDGIAAALRNPQVAKAIAAGARGRIAVALVLWSNMQSQMIAVPWRLLANATDLEIAARQIEATKRTIPQGGTGLAAGLDYASALFSALPIPATRHAIDVSGDGEDNEGGDAGAARDRAVLRGITINGLPIIDGDTSIVDYYRAQVIGGPDSFVEPTDTIMSFHDTILRKLLREVGEVVS